MPFSQKAPLLGENLAKTNGRYSQVACTLVYLTLSGDFVSVAGKSHRT